MAFSNLVLSTKQDFSSGNAYILKLFVLKFLEP